jgi:hypothetical protein
MYKIILFLGLLFTPILTMADNPNCSGPDNYAASMVFVYLKNAGLTTNEKIDWSKTKVTEIAHQQVGKDLYKQVHLVIYTELSGKQFAVIAVNDASSEECSMDGPDLYLISTYWPGDVSQKTKQYAH